MYDNHSFSSCDYVFYRACSGTGNELDFLTGADS